MAIDTNKPVLIVGLGNPGPRYEATRHNVGFLAADEIAESLSPMAANFSAHKKSGSTVAEGRIGGMKVVIAKPLSFMNLSGGPVSSLCNFYKIPAGNVIVLHDELDLDAGTIRLKVGGGDNGHNGLKSITKSLHTPDYFRVRIGIGRPPGRMAPADWVLKPLSQKDCDELAFTLQDAADAVNLIITDGLEKAQNIIHARGK